MYSFALLLILLGAFGNSDSNFENAAQASSFLPKFMNVRANLNNWSIALLPLGKLWNPLAKLMAANWNFFCT